MPNDPLVASMKALGLNQLWLDVFYDGALHCDNGKNGEPDILTEALARTKGTGIAVMPALSLLRWGANIPPDAQDVTASGETTVQAQAWSRHFSNLIGRGMTEEEEAQAEAALTQPTSAENQKLWMDAPQTDFFGLPPVEAWANPTAPSVQKVLLAAVRRLAATPGVSVLVLRDAVPPGYNRIPGSADSPTDGDGGYNPEMRLAFLRREHTDPLDLEMDPLLPEAVDLSLPNLDGPVALSGPGVNILRTDWNRFRYETNRALLGRLLAAAREAGGPHLRFLVNRTLGPNMGWLPEFYPDWYTLWDDPHAPLPGFLDVPSAGMPLYMTNPNAAARAQGRVNLCQLNGRFCWTLPMLTRALGRPDAGMEPGHQPAWDGVVLSLWTGPVPNPLAALAPPAEKSLGRISLPNGTGITPGGR